MSAGDGRSLWNQEQLGRWSVSRGRVVGARVLEGSGRSGVRTVLYSKRGEKKKRKGAEELYAGEWHTVRRGASPQDRSTDESRRMVRYCIPQVSRRHTKGGVVVTPSAGRK